MPGATQTATPNITRGPLRDWLDRAAPAMARNGIALCEWRRDRDAAIWPHATAGFFRDKQKTPRILERALPA
jgi:deoxyribodipyrimidine photo-lyase